MLFVSTVVTAAAILTHLLSAPQVKKAIKEGKEYEDEEKKERKMKNHNNCAGCMCVLL
jgi:hypothetical protein